jgi:hypothetical protein
MTRLAVICEGQTEEGFVKECLAPHLADHSVYATPRLLGKTHAREGEETSAWSELSRIFARCIATSIT